MIEQYSQQVKYKEPLLLFDQENGKLRNISAEAGPVFAKAFAARGARCVRRVPQIFFELMCRYDTFLSSPQSWETVQNFPMNEDPARR